MQWKTACLSNDVGGSFFSPPPLKIILRKQFNFIRYWVLSILSIWRKMNRENSSDSQQLFGITVFVLFHVRTRPECFDAHQNCTEVAHFHFWKVKIWISAALARNLSHCILDIFQVKTLACFIGNVLISACSSFSVFLNQNKAANW